MPELPEVETIRKGLAVYLVGHTIKRIEIRYSRLLTGDQKSILGVTIVKVRRFGKGLVIDFLNGYSLAVHIKMTGQFIYDGPKRPPDIIIDIQKVGTVLPNKHTHIIFHLDKKGILYYNDIRKFGWMKILKTDEVSSLPFFKSLGPEPLKDLTLQYFSSLLTNAKGPIKTVLLDQKKIGGIGNIYANDALYLAKVHPARKADSLDKKETQALFQAIEKVIAKGIAVGGASEWQYVNALGVAGKYQNYFQVYGRVGMPCKRCQTPIAKVKLGGRGTFYCPVCQ